VGASFSTQARNVVFSCDSGKAGEGISG
jgi:hypothetical protein